MRSLARTVVVSLAIPAMCAVAHASTLMYDFTATGTPYGNVSLSLPASPIPASFTATSFELASVPLTVDGDMATENIDFYTLAVGGGAGGGGTRVDGSQLFTGPTSSPTFLTGTFPIGGFSLTISNPTPSAVPEPSSLILLGTGLLGAVGILTKKLRFGENQA
ncbi:MAG: PEP-CTERM sorting domain-containing protein [Edaphobacter sp.]